MNNRVLKKITGVIVLTAMLFCIPQMRNLIRLSAAGLIYEAPVIRKGVIHIACVGDSITYGAGVLDEKERRIDELTWPYLLEQKYGESTQCLNYGVAGRTLLKESEYSYTDTAYYRLSMECGAEGYLIMLGSNDSKAECWNKERYEAELEEFVRAYTGLPQKPVVVLMTPPCAFAMEGSDTVAYGIRNEIIEREIVPIVKGTAEKLGIPCFDVYEETKTHPEWFGDGVHPNAEGNAAIAEIIFEKIREL